MAPGVMVILLGLGATGAAAATAGEGLWFREMLPGSGITYRNVSGEAAKRSILSSLGSGVCLLDFDLDGALDIYLVNGARLAGGAVVTVAANELYRSQGAWRYREVADRAGVADRSWGMGCAVGDVDNDGFDDIYVTNVGANLLYRNLGDGTFADVTGAAGVGDPRWGTSTAFLDADADGDLDLYVANYVGGDLLALPSGCRWFDLEVFCGPRGLEPAADVYYRNLGDGRFREATEGAGFEPFEAGYGLGVVVGDVEGDGDLDLYVANDSVANFLFVNEGGGRFREVALLTGAAFSGEGLPQGSMGVDMGDLNGDGLLDLFITNFSHDTYTPYVNVGDGFFVDDAAGAGLSQVTYFYLGWGTRFADLDNDGDEDLFAANGHVYPEVDRAKLRTRYAQRNQIYWNLGDGNFVEREPPAGDGVAAVQSSRGLAAGDLDNDGDLDLVVVNIDDLPSLLRNECAGGRHWVQFLLVARSADRNAIGARVLLTAAGRTQVKEVRPSGSYLSSSDRRVHFGLGSATRVERVEIRWPDGTRQVLTDLAADRVIRVVQGKGTSPAPPGRRSSSDR